MDKLGDSVWVETNSRQARLDLSACNSTLYTLSKGVWLCNRDRNWPDWPSTRTNVRLMHGPRPILAYWVVHCRVEDPKVVPDGDVAFLDWCHQNELRLQNTELDPSEELTDRDYVLNDLRVAVRARAEEEFPHADAVNMECLFASDRVDPNKWVLQR